MMSENRRLEQPFQKLGEKLKSLRVASKKSLSEVSGAVEIETTVYEQMEKGARRPPEEILSLLLSFYDVKEDEASNIWKLAGYDDNRSQPSLIPSALELGQPIAMLMPMDLRVVYTDMVNITVNNYGVVMNFMQSAAIDSQPLAVARVGMSKEHAKSVLDVLQQTLSQSQKQQKSLSDGSQQKDASDKQKSSDTPKS
jgi:transcriptional regulator with XRE-family HTH domain